MTGADPLGYEGVQGVTPRENPVHVVDAAPQPSSARGGPDTIAVFAIRPVALGHRGARGPGGMGGRSPPYWKSGPPGVNRTYQMVFILDAAVTPHLPTRGSLPPEPSGNSRGNAPIKDGVDRGEQVWPAWPA